MNGTEIIQLGEMSGEGIRYSVWAVRGIEGIYVIAARSQDDFYCGTLRCGEQDALSLMRELADSKSEPFWLEDIVKDFNCKNILYK